MKQSIKLSAFLFLFGFSSLHAQIDTLFTKCYGGSSEEPIGLGTGISGAPSIHSLIDASGNIYTATFTNSSDGDIPSGPGSEDIWLFKTDAQGILIWSRVYGGSDFDRCYSLILLQDGNILIAGRTASSNGTFPNSHGGEDGFLLKLNTDGDVVWSKQFGGSLPDTFFDVLEISGGDLMACGISGSIDGDINNSTYAGSNKAWLMRISPTGIPIWSRITNGLVVSADWEESFWYIKLNSASDAVYLLGASYNFNDVNSDDLFLSKYSLSGVQSLKKTFGGTAGDSPAGLIMEANDDILALGTIRGGSGNVTNYFAGNADAWLVKLNAAGTILWDKNYGGSNLDYAYGFVAGTGNSRWICSSTRSVDHTSIRTGNGLSDGFVIEVNANSGDTISTIRWGSSQNDYAHHVVLGNSNDIYVIGRSAGNDGWISGNHGGTDVVMLRFTGLTTDIPQLDESNILLYPNPAQHEVYFSGIDSPSEFEVFNVQGSRVMVGKLDSKHEIDCSSLPLGMYQVIIHSKDKMISKKLMISK